MGTKEFEEVKKEIWLALEEIKKQNIDLYNHLKEHIIMDEEKNTFCYDPTKSGNFNNQT